MFDWFRVLWLRQLCLSPSLENREWDLLQQQLLTLLPTLTLMLSHKDLLLRWLQQGQGENPRMDHVVWWWRTLWYTQSSRIRENLASQHKPWLQRSTSQGLKCHIGMWSDSPCFYTLRWNTSSKVKPSICWLCIDVGQTAGRIFVGTLSWTACWRLWFHCGVFLNALGHNKEAENASPTPKGPNPKFAYVFVDPQGFTKCTKIETQSFQNC